MAKFVSKVEENAGFRKKILEEKKKDKPDLTQINKWHDQLEELYGETFILRPFINEGEGDSVKFADFKELEDLSKKEEKILKDHFYSVHPKWLIAAISVMPEGLSVEFFDIETLNMRTILLRAKRAVRFRIEYRLFSN